jgi:hypothetical protein
MINFKELLEKFPSDGLDNLCEKIRWEYDDADITPDNEPFPEEIEAVIDNLYKQVVNYDFDKLELKGVHVFLVCDNKLSKKLGFDSITVCPYKDFESEPIDSNFIYTDTEHGGKSLVIDIYNVTNPFRYKIENRWDIEQEFMNFLRDAQWVIDGVYEEEIEKMKNNHNFLDIFDDEEEDNVQ